MKKILPFLMILMVLFTFVACDNGNGGGDEGITSIDKEKETVAASFADCTTVLDSETEITISDGNWTVKAFMSFDEMGMQQGMTAKATAEGGVFTFTSGSSKATVDYAVMLKDSPEALEMLKQLSDEEKTAMMSESEEMLEGATVEWDGLKATMSVPLGEEDLAEMQEEMDFSTLPEDAVVKTNDDNTKYVIIIEDDGKKEEYYISKD